MKKIVLFSLSLVFLCSHLFAQGGEYIKVVSLISDEDSRILLSSAGKAEKRSDVYVNAVKSAFYTLFYVGVTGVNDGNPLITDENVTYTDTFFDENNLWQYYIVENDQNVRISRENGMYKGTYTIEVKYKSLIDALIKNKVHTSSGQPQLSDNPIQPTVMAVPFANHNKGESFSSVLNNNTDIRVAINAVKNAFVNKGLDIVDFETILRRASRIEQYNDNAGDAWSNDKQLLQSSDADIYVTVFVEKKESSSGIVFTLIIEANDIMTGKNYGSKEISLPPIRTEAINRLCSEAASKIVPELIEDIEKGLIAGAQEIRIPIEFSIYGESAMTMNSRVGPMKYPISNIIHQWIGQNAYNRQFKRRGIVDTNMRYDYVVIPPVDADGMPMDAGQFAFLLEMYLKEEIGVNCISRMDGNLLLFTLDPPEDYNY